jgi:hypothetical protein
MMKTNTYRNGSKSCRSYLRTVGNGWEVGFFYGGKPVFLGNFIHSSEANQFYALMKTEIRNFGRKVRVAHPFPSAWFKAFLGAHLQKTYYQFVNQQVRRHQTEAKRTYGKGLRAYRRLNRRWTGEEKTPSLRAA